MTKRIGGRIRSSRGPGPARCSRRGVGVVAAVLSLGLLGAACDGRSSAQVDGSPLAERDRQPVHVDSVFPIDEEIRRFRVGLTEATELTEGASSPEGLADLFIQRLAAGDTLGLASLALSREEFAWLYYPHTMYTTPPYELSPALVWFQLQNRSSRGLNRALQRYAGEELHYTGIRCPDEGEAFGEGWIRHGCAVLGRLPDDTEVEERLFGSILELSGRYKLVGFSNEL